jgi:hypothetical protein
MTVERLPLVLPKPAGTPATRPGPPHRGRVTVLVAEPFEDPPRGRPMPDPFNGIIDKILMEDEGS